MQYEHGNEKHRPNLGHLSKVGPPPTHSLGLGPKRYVFLPLALVHQIVSSGIYKIRYGVFYLFKTYFCCDTKLLSRKQCVRSFYILTDVFIGGILF